MGMELYNLDKDPGEFTNLAGNPEYKSVVGELGKRLLSKRGEAGYSDFKALKSNKRDRKKRKK